MPSSSHRYDAVIVGAGPNGLSAAIVLARAGLSTLVLEAEAEPGGGCRSQALTAPGFLHDTCSTVHPLGKSSSFFRTLGLEQYGLRWVDPGACVAHLLGDGQVVMMEKSLAATAAGLGSDGPAYVELLEPFVERFERLMEMVLGPLRWPRDPTLYARFGLAALPSLSWLARQRFHGEAAPALLAGAAAHAMLPLDRVTTASFALVLGASAHAVGWPLAEGGSRAISDALVACLRAHGGELRLNTPVMHHGELPPARAYLLDVTPRQLLAIYGDAMPQRYARRLRRFRYGPGVFKIDWALDAPIPWRDPRCARAGTVHLSGTLQRISEAEAAVHAGGIAAEPFTLLVQPSLFDPSRAPAGAHTAWAYCHVPHGSTQDVAAAIESHIERFAPGFRSVVRARATKNATEMERFNRNYVGGDINGGLADIGQLLFRPLVRVDPYATALDNVFLCSSSTPPGGGVHGMCGYWAARSALRKVFAQPRAHELAARGTADLGEQRTAAQ